LWKLVLYAPGTADPMPAVLSGWSGASSSVDSVESRPSSRADLMEQARSGSATIQHEGGFMASPGAAWLKWCWSVDMAASYAHSEILNTERVRDPAALKCFLLTACKPSCRQIGNKVE
jgi:hypothetical protein